MAETPAKEQLVNYLKDISETDKLSQMLAKAEKPSEKASDLLNQALAELENEKDPAKREKDKNILDRSQAFIEQLKVLENSDKEEAEEALKTLGEKYAALKEAAKEESKVKRDELAAEIQAGTGNPAEKAFNDALAEIGKNPLNFGAWATLLSTGWALLMSNIWPSSPDVIDEDLGSHDYHEEDDMNEDGKVDSDEKEVSEALEENTPAFKVIQAVNKLLKEGVTGKNCWDWIQQVYGEAKVRRKTIFKSSKYGGNGAETIEPKGLLQTGDWIFINNKNKYDSKGDHSVIFLRWADEEKKIAVTANCGGSGKVGKIDQRNLVKQPVTFVMRPVA